MSSPLSPKKIYDAKKYHKKQITVWGDGSASREFLYVEDAARSNSARRRKV